MLVQIHNLLQQYGMDELGSCSKASAALCIVASACRMRVYAEFENMSRS